MSKVPPQRHPPVHVPPTKKPIRLKHHHMHDPHEVAHAQHMAEALGWGPETQAEAEERKADREEERKEEEREQQNGAQRVQVTAKAATPANESQGAHSQLQKQQQQTKRDAFQPKAAQQGWGEAGKTKQPVTDFQSINKIGASAAVTAAKTTDAVREAQERALKSGKPPDAFTLLNAAQPHGVFFKEEHEREGGGDGQEDPELAAAVEEAIRVLFGVRGILRIGPGRNQADEPVVIIVVQQGFGEASFRMVPEKVGKFGTLLALPFDVLPLKKER